MEFIKTPIEGLTLIKPKRFEDRRGYFMEVYNRDVFDPVIGPVDFIQDNESESTRGVLRGLHLQAGEASQAKLVRVVEGSVFDVAVDLRKDSPTFGHWHGVELSHENGLMMFIPRGFAHGFAVLSSRARFVYKVDNRYAPEAEVTVAYDDPQIGVRWPEIEGGFILSDKDIDRAISLGEFLAKF